MAAEKGMTEFRVDGEDYKVNDPNIANEFSSSAVYQKGEYFYHNGVLYRVTADHASGTSFSDTGKTAVLIGEEIKMQQDDITDLEDAVEEAVDKIDRETRAIVSFESDLNEIELTGNADITFLSDTGIIPEDYGADEAEAANLKASPLIKIAEGARIRFSKSLSSAVYSTNFYDKDGELISYKYNDHENMMAIAPAGAVYCRFCVGADTYAWLSSLKSDRLLASEYEQIDLEKYGYLAECVINTDGDIVGATGSAYRVTNYLPVRAGQQIILPYALFSHLYVNVFYNASLEAVKTFENYPASTMAIAPDGAEFVRITTVSTISRRLLYYNNTGSPLKSISTEMYGAAGDGITDDTDAIQHMMDMAGWHKLKVIFPKGKFLITAPIQLNNANMEISGAAPSYDCSTIVVKTFEQTVDSEGNIEYPTDANGYQIQVENPPSAAFIVKGVGSKIENINFTCNIIASEASYKKDALLADGIVYDLHTSGRSNNDSDIKKCNFGMLNNGIRMKGKNVKITDCLFSYCNCGIKLTASARYGYEQRGFVISDNRFHYIGANKYYRSVAYDRSRACIQWPIYYVDTRMAKLSVIKNNFADYCGDFFAGDARSIVIQNNVLYLSRGALVRSLLRSYTGDGTPVEKTGSQIFSGDDIPHGGIDIYGLAFNESGLLSYSNPVEVTPGGLVEIESSFVTEFYGHGMYDANGVLVDAVMASNEGKVPIPSNVYSMRFVCITSEISDFKVKLYSDYSIATGVTEKSFSNQPIIISGNNISGNISTGLVNGYNVMDNAIEICGYSDVNIRGNDFAGGVSDTIVITDGERINCSDNTFWTAPSFCEITDDQGDVTVATGVGKNYIKMANVEGEIISRNTAFFGERYDGSTDPYVSVAVTMDGDAYQADSSNVFPVSQA